MLYFAYGSNMSLARLCQRAPSATRIGRGCLQGQCLRFHKISQRDGSAKCDAHHTGLADDRVWGVLYRIDPGERQALDLAEGEGMGYRVENVEVIGEGGEVQRAFTYLATLIDDRLLPYRGYRQHVLIGARENGLPEDYIEAIASVAVAEDPDEQRHRREWSIHGSNEWWPE